MAETLFDSYKSITNPNDTSSDPSDPSKKTDGAPFSRKIDFHLARKPYSGFSNGVGGFKLETLNPTRLDPHRPGGSIQGSGFSGLGGKNKPDGSSSEFLDFGLDPELRFGITFRRIVSCFILRGIIVLCLGLGVSALDCSVYGFLGLLQLVMLCWVEYVHV